MKDKQKPSIVYWNNRDKNESTPLIKIKWLAKKGTSLKKALDLRHAKPKLRKGRGKYGKTTLIYTCLYTTLRTFLQIMDFTIANKKCTKMSEKKNHAKSTQIQGFVKITKIKDYTNE